MTATVQHATGMSAPPAPAELSVRRLTKSFVPHLLDGRPRRVLAGIDLHVPAGRCVAITGSSGSGKSSLLRCVYRTYRPDSGQVLLAVGGQVRDLAAASDREVLTARATSIGMVTQFLNVVPRLSAVELVAAAGLARGAAADMLIELGLASDLLAAPPATFSGGERQIVNVAMALARPRSLLLLDEATASLDHQRRARVLAALATAKRAGTTMLAVFHDVPATPGLVDSVVRLTDGRVAQ